MGQFKVTRPSHEIKALKGWTAGRIGQLKLFLGHLESSINTSLAAQVAQNPRKEFSEFVPKVTDITAEIEFREIRIRFNPPKGLRRFLLYEYQISGSSSFFSFDSLTSPEPFHVFSDLQDAAIYFMRVRVITTNGFVGPWSDTIEGQTPDARAVSFRENIPFDTFLTNTDWQTIYTTSVEAIGGKAYFSMEYEVKASVGTDLSNNLHWADVEFRYLINGDQTGQDMGITVYSTKQIGSFSGNGAFLRATTDALNPNEIVIPGPFGTTHTGTFIIPFTELDANILYDINLQARIMPSTNIHPITEDYIFDPAWTAVIYADESGGPFARISIKNFSYFEVATQ